MNQEHRSRENRFSGKVNIVHLYAINCFVLFAAVFVYVLRLSPAVTASSHRTFVLLSCLLFCIFVFNAGSIYFFVILPIIRLQKHLNKIETSEDISLFKSFKRPLFLSSVYSSLQNVMEMLEKLLLNESNTKLMKKQAELDALQSQINPHFLYNTLDTIRGQANMAGHRNIEAMSLALSKLFRYSISNYDDLVPLKEELKAVDNYFMIQNYRFDNRFIKQYYIDDDTVHNKVPKMLIQPLVENAILHGLEPKIGKGTIQIKAYKTDSRLIISVDDDGIGIEPVRLTEINDALSNNIQQKITKRSGTSIGLYNINARLRLLFGEEYHIAVSSTLNIGTSMVLSLPIVS